MAAPPAPQPRAFLAASLGIALALGGFLAFAVANAPGPAAKVPAAALAPPPVEVPRTAPAEVAQAKPLPGTPAAMASYAGPTDGPGVAAACAAAPDRVACATQALVRLLAAHGSGPAFDALEALGASDALYAGQGHPMAHVLGRSALDAYGSIRLALQECSYKVFAGCFHGALQEHFERLQAVDEGSVQGLCPSDNAFRQYTCLHGVGHGLMLATRYDLPRSLALCDALEGSFAQGSCHGGAFMENIVGYFDSLQGAHHHDHDHGDGAPVVYAVDRARPAYPCDASAEHTQGTCWLMQTSLVLHFNGGDFRAAAQVCARDAGLHADACFRSLGRDAASYTKRDAAAVAGHCAHAPPEGNGRALCIRGFVAESVLHYASPEAGLRACAALPQQDKGACYDEVGVQGRGMRDADAMAQACAQAEPGWEKTCRAGALLSD
jgi:hypothetical protein